MAESAPPGWYSADGDAPGVERFWDGSVWTDTTRQAAPPPAFPVSASVPAHDEWNPSWWLASFKGRAHRGHFWAGHAIVAAAFLAGAVAGGQLDADPGSEVTEIFLVLAISATYLLGLWIAMAVQVKRWHDRNQSGWMVLINLIPFVSIWALISLGFLEGTRGPNQYGDHRGPVYESQPRS